MAPIKYGASVENPFINESDGAYYGPVYSANFSPNSKYFVIGGLSGYTQVYGFGKIDQMGRAKLYSTAGAFGEGQVYQTIFSPDGKYFASAIGSGEIIISPMSYGLYNDSKVWHIEFNRNNDLIATSSMDGTAKVWNHKHGSKYFGSIS